MGIAAAFTNTTTPIAKSDNMYQQFTMHGHCHSPFTKYRIEKMTCVRYEKKYDIDHKGKKMISH